MRYFLLIIYLTSIIKFSYAQAPASGRISTKVLDDKSKGVDGATVSLFKVSDSSLVKVNITERDGSVSFEQIKSGSYFLTVNNVGYTKYSTGKITIDQSNQQINVPDISLQPEAHQLGEVNVQAKKPFIERQLDKVVVNVSSSIVSAGGTALEVLQRSPGVLVNQNDDISMKGKQGVIVMIDDKPTYLSATDLANMLRSMPANSIDKIELITNPSSKYDAAGSSGIINIKLKKDQRYGTNGNFSFSAGQGVYGKLNTGLSLNYRSNKINLFGNYNYTYRESFNHLELHRDFFNPDGTLNGAYKQDNYLKFPLKSNLIKAGMDYSPSKNTTIGVVFTGLLTKFDPTGINSSDVLDSLQQKVSYFKTNSDAMNRLHNYSGNLNFKHSIDTAGQEISADLDYAYYGNRSLQNYTTKYFNLDGTAAQPDNILQDQQPGILNIYSIKADYALPLK